MRTRIGLLGMMTLLCTAACGDASTSERGVQPGAREPAGATSDDDSKSSGDETLADSTPPEEEEALPGQPVTMTDVDKDGIADEKDCDSTNPGIGLRLVDDALATDATLFAAANGFPSASWTYADSAYRQTRLADAGDATFFMGDSSVGDVDLEVRTASTEISSALGPTLRQMFVLVGAKMENGTLTAWGCGAEVVAGMTPTQRTSVVKLSGAPGAITTTPIQRTARTILKEGEDYAIKARVSGGKITCTVMQGQDLDTLTTAEAIDQGEIKGALGFYTRQTKAYFKNVKACKLQAFVSAPN
jgi:hypothetical protein